MKLNNNIYLPQKDKQISFNSKCSVLKDADWVCRSVNKNFPAVSNTWLNYNLHIANDNNKYFISCIGKKIHNARCNNNSELIPLKFLKILLEQVKDNKAANCYEKATIAELILKMNGVNNCNRVDLVANNGQKKLNHCVLLVNFDQHNYYPSLQKLLIIDPWCGESGFADVMFKKYVNMFNDFFKLRNGEDIQFVKRNSLDLSIEDIDFFKKDYSELLFKSSDNHKLFAVFILVKCI